MPPRLLMPARSLVLAATASLTLVGMAPDAARSDQRDARLDPLFARLQSTASDTEAQAIERRIWLIWSESAESRLDALMQEGVVAMAQRRLRAALERFDRMVEQAPDFAEAWNKRATVHFLMGDYRVSVRDIQRTLDLEPRHFGALSGLGLIYDALEQPAAALRSFEAAVAINPHLGSTRARIEQLRRELGGSPI
jgi:tetratricopeptide (TPR) repeat protein